MRYRTIVLWMVMSTVCALAQRPGFRLEGRIHGLPSGTAVLTVFSYVDAEKTVRDTAIVEDGAFRFAGTLVSPMLADVSFRPGRLRMAVFLEEGALHVTGDALDTTAGGSLRVSVTGSKSHDEYARVDSFKRDEVDSLYNLMLKEKDGQRKSALKARVEDLNDLIGKNAVEFVEGHSNSAVSAYYMIFNTNDNTVSFQRLKDIVTGFGPIRDRRPITAG